MGTCERCGGNTVDLPTKVGDQDLVLRRCATCDLRQWRRGDEVIDLTTVLDLTAEAHASRGAKRSSTRP
ncbi:MAG: hypothetical protein KY458_13150 [Actinobacteria bacterium]|nr:hypothetical protein [Actinomycetota bacterium]